MSTDQWRKGSRLEQRLATWQQSISDSLLAGTQRPR
jgi:hypothetical protein